MTNRKYNSALGYSLRKHDLTNDDELTDEAIATLNDYQFGYEVGQDVLKKEIEELKDKLEFFHAHDMYKSYWTSN